MMSLMSGLGEEYLGWVKPVTTVGGDTSSDGTSQNT
jgi:hypothetical protein